jgi:hypothetical protein
VLRGGGLKKLINSSLQINLKSGAVNKNQWGEWSGLSTRQVQDNPELPASWPRGRLGTRTIFVKAAQNSEQLHPSPVSEGHSMLKAGPCAPASEQFVSSTEPCDGRRGWQRGGGPKIIPQQRGHVNHSLSV